MLVTTRWYLHHLPMKNNDCRLAGPLVPLGVAERLSSWMASYRPWWRWRSGELVKWDAMGNWSDERRFRAGKSIGWFGCSIAMGFSYQSWGSENPLERSGKWMGNRWNMGWIDNDILWNMGRSDGLHDVKLSHLFFSSDEMVLSLATWERARALAIVVMRQSYLKHWAFPVSGIYYPYT